MNAYISDRIAREHADRLMADARAARRVRRARASRSAVVRSAQHGESGERSGSAAHFVARPFVALHQWLVAGQM